MFGSRRHDIAAIALLTLIAVALFADVLTGSSVFFYRDFSRYYFPVKKMMRDIVLGGEFPWWTRAYSAGQPLAANPEHEVFYPLTWLILLPNFAAALHAQVVLHIAIALAGMYAFLRSLELRPFPSFFGALSFGAGGVMLSYINLLPYLYCIAWLPFTCLYARRFLLRNDKRSLALACLFLGLQMLVGEPTTVAQTGLILFAYALYRAYHVHRIRPVISVIAVGAIAVLVGAVQIIPTVDLVRDSARAQPLSFDAVAEWSMPWPKLLELIQPNALGHLMLGQMPFYWGTNLYGAHQSPFLVSIYPGLLVTILAIAGLGIRRRGAGLVLGLCVVSIIIAAGDHSPLLRWLYDAGVASRLRYPEKFLMTAIFALTVFAAQMLDALHADPRARAAARNAAIAVAVVLAVMLVWSFTPSYGRQFAALFSLPAASAAFPIQRSRFDLLIGVLRGIAALTLLLFASRSAHPLWMLSASALALLDFSRLSPEVAPRAAPELLERPAVHAPFGDTAYRTFHEADWFSDTVIGRRWRTGERNYWVRRNGLFPMFSTAWAVPIVMNVDPDQTSLLPTVAFLRAAGIARARGGERAVITTMAMSNARYRAVYRPFDASAEEADPRSIDPVAFVDTVRQPRYYFGWPVVPMRDANDFAAQVSRQAWPLSVAFVEHGADVNASGAVRTVRESSNSAAIDVESFGRGLLVMSVTPHRYWRVFVDGVRVTPVVTNIGYQGVPVGPGMHHVTMRYRNDVVVASGFVSLLTALGLVLIAARRSA